MSSCPGRGRQVAEPIDLRRETHRLRHSRRTRLTKNQVLRAWDQRTAYDKNNVPAPKIFLSEVKAGRVPQTLWSYKDVGHNQEAKKEFLELLPIENAEAVFDTPKPTRLIKRMLDLGSTADGNDIILDFFAGSGTTGHAVMDMNTSDGGNRRFICVHGFDRNAKVEAELEQQLIKHVLLGTIAL